MMEWKDIESAPKNWTQIVAHDTATGTSHVTWWDGRKWYDPDNHYYSETEPFYPTHWMPLPPPPTGEKI